MVAFWRRTTVRIDGGRDHDGPGDFQPDVESNHERLLAELVERADQAWSARALRTILEGVRDHRGIEHIAITDAWTEDGDAFCLIYTPPWGPTLAGIRRQRGDLDPVAQLVGKGNHTDAEFRTPADPEGYGLMVLDDISQPLGRVSERLRHDRHGVGWWGTLSETLPERPA